MAIYYVVANGLVLEPVKSSTVPRKALSKTSLALKYDEA